MIQDYKYENTKQLAQLKCYRHLANDIFFIQSAVLVSIFFSVQILFICIQAPIPIYIFRLNIALPDTWYHLVTNN